MANNTLPEYTPQIGRQYVAHMSNLARVLSGEMEGKGRTVKKLQITPSSPCATDGETVFLSYPIFPSVTDARQNLIITEAILAHEAAGHLRYTNFNAWKRVTDKIKKGDEDKLLHDFVNIFEDARVNYLLGQDFAGSKKRLDFAQALVLSSHKSSIVGRVLSDGEAPKMGVLAIATEAILGIGHYMNHPKIIAMMDEARPLFTAALSGRDTSEVIKEAKKILTVYRNYFPEDETGGSEYGASHEDCAEGIFADDMSPESIKEAADNQKNQKKQAEKVKRARFDEVEIPDGDSTGEGAGAGDGDDEEGEGAGAGAGGEGEGEESSGDSGDCEGDGKGEGEGDGDSGGDSEDGAGGDDEGEGVGNTVTEGGDDNEGNGEMAAEMAVMGDNHVTGLISGGDGSGEAIFAGVDYAENLLAAAGDMIHDMEGMEFDDNGELIEPVIGHSTEVKDYRGHIIITQKNPQWRDADRMATISDYSKVANENRGGINRLAQQIKNLVKGADSRFSTHHKRGKLDTHRLYAHTTSPRIFKRTKTLKAFNLNCLILIDASGSMGGRRASNAAQAAVTLAEAMEKVGANYEIVDFNSTNGAYRGHPNGATYINVRKAFDEQLGTVTKKQIATPFAGSQNSDGFAVKWAMTRVMAQNRINGDDAQSMVFIISDGQPAGPSPDKMGAHNHLVEVLAEAESQDCILFSVGIDGMDTKEYYSRHGYATVHDSSTLAQDIVVPLKTALKKAIRR